MVRARGSKGGNKTRDLYGRDYYNWLSRQRKVKMGWPKGKARRLDRIADIALKTIRALNLRPEAQTMFEKMIAVSVSGSVLI